MSAFKPSPVDGFAVVSAVQAGIGQPDCDASSLGRIAQRVGPVLYQLEELAVSIAAVRRILLDVGVFEDEVALGGVRVDRSAGLLLQVGAQIPIRSGPILRTDGRRQNQLGVRMEELAALTLRKVVLGSHLFVSYCRRSRFPAGRAEMMRTLAASTLIS